MIRRSVLAVVFALVAIMVPISSASADPPAESGIVERFQAQHGFAIIEVPDDGVWILANFDSLDDFCEGPNPAKPVSVQLVHLPNGVIVFRNNVGVVPIVVVPMESDDPFADACDNGEAIAWGSWDVRVNDNDIDVSGTRANVFGEHSNGSAVDSDGNHYKVHSHIKLQISKDGEFRVLSEGASFRQLPN